VTAPLSLTIRQIKAKDGKIWLQQNTTDVNVGQELQEMGISREDFVLGLHPCLYSNSKFKSF